MEEELDRISAEMTRYPSDFDKLQPLAEKFNQVEEELLYKMERQEYLARLAEELAKIEAQDKTCPLSHKR